jgi:hypothetical protein
MVYKETIAVCSEIHTKHINSLCGQNVDLLNVKLGVYKVNLSLQKVTILMSAFRCCLQYQHSYCLHFVNKEFQTVHTNLT